MARSTTAPSPTPSSTERLRVLALSGGGFLGLYTATVLAGLEMAVQKFGPRKPFRMLM